MKLKVGDAHHKDFDEKLCAGFEAQQDAIQHKNDVEIEVCDDLDTGDRLEDNVPQLDKEMLQDLEVAFLATVFLDSGPCYGRMADEEGSWKGSRFYLRKSTMRALICTWTCTRMDGIVSVQ